MELGTFIIRSMCNRLTTELSVEPKAEHAPLLGASKKSGSILKSLAITDRA